MGDAFVDITMGLPKKFRVAIKDFGFDLDEFLRRPKSRMLDRNEKTYIYLFTTGEYCKIGISRDVEQRRQHLEVCSPYDLSVEAVRGFTSFLYALEAEKAAHAMLAPYAHRNEWFRIDRPTAKLALVSAYNAVRLLQRRHAQAGRRQGSESLA